jgi:hypothetical protein
MGPVCSLVQAHDCLAFRDTDISLQKKSSDRPDRIQLRLAVYEMFEIRGCLQVSRHLAECLGGKIADRNHVSRIDRSFYSHGITVT